MRRSLGDDCVVSRLIAAAVAVLLASGCTPSASTGATRNPDRAPWCPDLVPEEGTPCTQAPEPPGVLTACEYGTQPHCSTLASCVRGGDQSSWVIQPPDPSCAGNPASCPPSFADGSVEACTAGTSCLYPHGRCVCSACGASPGSPNVCGAQDAGTGWACEPWGGPGDGCPSAPVLLGTPCTPPSPNGGICGSNSGQIAVCANGYWSLGIGGP